MRERACLLSPIIYFVCTRPGGGRARDSAPASGHPIILFQPPVMANSALLLLGISGTLSYAVFVYLYLCIRVFASFYLIAL